MTQNWRSWNIGDTIKWSWNDFEGSGSVIGVITKKESDHLIVEAEGMKLWVDDTTSNDYKKLA